MRWVRGGEERRKEGRTGDAESQGLAQLGLALHGRSLRPVQGPRASQSHAPARSGRAPLRGLSQPQSAAAPGPSAWGTSLEAAAPYWTVHSQAGAKAGTQTGPRKTTADVLAGIEPRHCPYPGQDPGLAHLPPPGWGNAEILPGSQTARHGEHEAGGRGQRGVTASRFQHLEPARAPKWLVLKDGPCQTHP